MSRSINPLSLSPMKQSKTPMPSLRSWRTKVNLDLLLRKIRKARVEEEVVEKSGEGSDDELAEHSATEKTTGTASPIAPKKKFKWWKVAAIGIAAGSVVGGATFVIAAPLVVAGLGFTAGGIAAGSAAASMMSVLAPTVAGGIVATLQSVGAVGFSAAGVAALAGAGGTVGAVGAAAATAGTVALASKKVNKSKTAKD